MAAVKYQILDCEMTPNEQRQCETIRDIPPGRVMWYGQVSAVVGSRTGLTTASLLARNPDELDGASHRVVGKKGYRGVLKTTGERLRMQRQLLRREGVPVDDHDSFDLDGYAHKP